MKRLLLATAAVLALAAPGHAFTNMSQPLQNYTHLECVPTFLQPRDHDPNPVYKIEVDLQLDDSPQQGVTDIEAVHVLRDGTTVDRSNQYQGGRIWQKPDFTEWYWNGTLARNPRLTMTGRIVRTATGRWSYEEKLFDRGRQDFHMASACHVENAG